MQAEAADAEKALQYNDDKIFLKALRFFGGLLVKLIPVLAVEAEV
jgi:hypothetical protein